VRSYLRQLQHQTQKLAHFFFAPDVRYAASG
jgi:hypothetical protein